MGRQVRLTVITCTGNRPEAFALCERWMVRQTVKPFQWLVICDGDTPTKCTQGQELYYCPDFKGKWSMVRKVKMAVEQGLIKGDALVFIEDDDWVAADWIEFCTKHLEYYQLIGEGRAIYYNPTNRFWFIHPNLAHASLCSTAVRRNCFDTLLKVCNNSNPFIDARLWREVLANKKVFDPNQDKRRVVGIKGMPGRVGYGSGHVIRESIAVDDPNLDKLTELIGEDAQLYAGFLKQP